MIVERWSLNASILEFEGVLRSLIKQSILIDQESGLRPPQSGDRNLKGGVVSRY